MKSKYEVYALDGPILAEFDTVWEAIDYARNCERLCWIYDSGSAHEITLW